MNCHDFNDRLQEYIDGSLDSKLHIALRAHLEQCPDCRNALASEQALARSLNEALTQAATDLELSPAARREILNAKSAIRVPAHSRRFAWRAGTLLRRRPAALAAAALVALAVVLGSQFFRRSAEGPVSSGLAASTGAVWTIDVPIRIHAHLFDRRGDSVVDAMVSDEAVGQARFAETRGLFSKAL